MGPVVFDPSNQMDNRVNAFLPMRTTPGLEIASGVARGRNGRSWYRNKGWTRHEDHLFGLEPVFIRLLVGHVDMVNPLWIRPMRHSSLRDNRSRVAMRFHSPAMMDPRLRWNGQPNNRLRRGCTVPVFRTGRSTSGGSADGRTRHLRVGRSDQSRKCCTASLPRFERMGRFQ